MNDNALNNALLPVGLRDVLARDAAFAARASEFLLERFALYGYERVDPPLIEFEASLNANQGASLAAQTFRVVDPLSQKMMAIRADITPQIARIAATRLAHAQRPLRLSYAGEVLRIKGSQLRPERQFRQVGAEIIGSNSALATAEVINIAAQGLKLLGIEGVSVDLSLPTLVPILCQELGIEPTQALREALDHKDSTEAAKAHSLLPQLIAAAGPADQAFTKLDGLTLPPLARAEITRLEAVAKALKELGFKEGLTLDPVENRGFEYHNGPTFTLFATGAAYELGRGGGYQAGTGVTLFMDTVLRLANPPLPLRKIYLAWGTPAEIAENLRNQGIVAIMALDSQENAVQTAKDQGCSGLWQQGQLIDL